MNMDRNPVSGSLESSRPQPAFQGETINAPALTAMLKQIIANNRAGGWRRLKRDA